MFEWIVKKVIVGKINDLLKSNKGNVDVIRETLCKWIARIRMILSCFESILSKLEDGKISSDELNETAEEVNTVIKSW